MKETITQSRPTLFAAVSSRTLLVLFLLLGAAGVGAAQNQQPPDALTITKEGNVGVGRTTPPNKLSVAGNADFAGDVGIGTASPVSKFHIHGNYSNTGAGGFALDASDNDNPEQYVLRINPFAVGNARVGYQFQTKSTVGGTQLPLTFDNEGRVGIGTIKPVSGLSISSVKQQSNSANQEIGQLSFVGFNRNAASASILAQSPGWDDVGHLIFKTSPGNQGAQERMRITSDGNVGIGTTDPAFAKLQVAGGATTALRLEANSGVAAMSIGGTGQLVVDAPGVTGGRFIVTDNGNVGIGTSSPDKAKLEIRGSSSEYAMPVFDYFTLFNQVQRGAAGKYALSLYADNRIAASHFMAFSDERIKNIQGRSNSSQDLQTLLHIEVTDFRYKDVIGKGSASHKKVIAQQVEKVFPQAVSRQTDVVPDIYQSASFMDGWVELTTDLKKGERVRLISDQAEGVYEVLEVSCDKFRTDFKPTGNRVFVYGREVNDFRTLDYDAIAMLNVSATQQLKKEKDAEVKSLQDENAALRSQLAAQAKRLAELEAKDKTRDEKLAAIERRLLSADKR